MGKQIEIGTRVTVLLHSLPYLPFKDHVTKTYKELVYLVDEHNRSREHVLMSWELDKYYEPAEMEADQEFIDKAQALLKRQNQTWIKI